MHEFAEALYERKRDGAVFLRTRTAGRWQPDLQTAPLQIASRTLLGFPCSNYTKPGCLNRSLVTKKAR
ncbi:hypothetical protein BKD03_12565 [Brucella sp. 09RB8471]|nr:hypothetical protein BKD03_12565 [Brucella sp. 09RB8471]